MKARTKMICTIGPSVNSVKQMVQLIHHGMDVARVNFSHGTYDEHRTVIQNLKKAREQCQRPLGIMLDTKGPEIRLGSVPKEGIVVEAGSTILLVRESVEGTRERISIRPPSVLEYFKPGILILIDNGYIQARVVEQVPEGVRLRFENSGVIFSSKGVNVPEIGIPLPALTEKDVQDIEFGCEEGVDLIAASFIQTADNIVDIKRLLCQFKRPEIFVLAKIESAEGVRNFTSILHVADGIMVARGDLGVEVPLSHVPRLQKMMIRKSNIVGKPVVTATQMLESMMSNPRPTRAEVSDVANAIYDGTSAVMLSGETAVGQYPQETAKLMKTISKETEHDFDYKAFFEYHTSMTYRDISSAITLAAVKTAYSLNAQAIFTFTHSGVTARLLSRLKPKVPVIALTPREKTYHQLALCWGVVPVFCQEPCSSLEEAFQYASRWSLDEKIISYGDLVILIAGSPFWVSGTSNTILVSSIGDVLVRGSSGWGERAQGSILFVPGSDVHVVPGSILVFSRFESSDTDLLHNAAGVILQRSAEDHVSEELLIEACRKEGKPVIVGVEEAFRVLEEKQEVTLDPPKAIVYKGNVR